MAAALLAVLTGASYQVVVGGNGAGQLAVGSRPSTETLAAAASTVLIVTTTSVAPPAAAAGADSLEVVAGHGAASGNDRAAPGGDREPSLEQPDPDPEPVRTRSTPPPASEPVTSAPPPPPAPAALTRLPNVELEVLTLTNIDRGNNGVPPVHRDGCMDAEASAWAASMAQSATMAHSGGAEGAVQGCRGGGAYWGDNIGYWQPCSAAAMETWWMGSASHRPHILDANFTVVGVGVWTEPSGRCWFQVYFGS